MKRLVARLVGCWSVWLLAFIKLTIQATAAEADVCAVCGGPFVEVYYSIEDKVTLEKRHVCKECEKSFPDCFVCGLPANTNSAGFIQLPDQRVLCSRDARTAVLEEQDGIRICREVEDGLNRLFSRYTSFPQSTVTIGVLDRVNLMSLFKLAGNDYHCPNVWGLTETKTNHSHLDYRISLMTGLPLAWFKATCAHEYGHAWIGDHLSVTRREQLIDDAKEGFCELVSYLYMQSLGDETQKAMILRNGYTRGHIDLFVSAERSYGLNEILDWMQLGTDDRLSPDDPGRIRTVAARKSVAAASPAQSSPAAAVAPSAPVALLLKAIFWDQKRPLAIINDHAFAPNEQATMRIGATNIVVRCLTISSNSVQLRLGADQDQTLKLKRD